MNAKRILFIVLCALLAIMLTLAGIVIFKFVGTSTPNQPTVTTPTIPVDITPTEPPTDAPTEPPATEHVHDYVLKETVDATCTGYGWKVYTCRTCKITNMPADQRTDPLGHNYETSTVTESTCTEPGITEEVCTRCGDKTATQKEPLGHSWGYGAVHDATCTEGGGTKFTCLLCGTEEIKDQTEPLGHAFGEPTHFPATCTEDAYTLALCTREGCDAHDQVIEVGTATGHTAGTWHYQGPNEFYLHCSVCAISLRKPAGEGIAYDILLNQQQAMTDETGAAYTSHAITIGVPDDASVEAFTYTVNNYLGDENLTISYQVGVGFVMTILLDGTQQSYSINHCAPLTITISPDGIPTIE